MPNRNAPSSGQIRVSGRNSAAAPGAGAANEDVGEFGFDAPGPDSFRGLGKWKSHSAMKNVAAEMTEFLFDIKRSFDFEAKFALINTSETIFDRFGQITVQAIEAILRGPAAGGVIIRIE